MPKSTRYLLHILIPSLISLFVFVFSGDVVNGMYTLNANLSEGPYYITALSYSLSFLIFALYHFMGMEKEKEKEQEV